MFSECGYNSLLGAVYLLFQQDKGCAALTSQEDIACTVTMEFSRKKKDKDLTHK